MRPLFFEDKFPRVSNPFWGSTSIRVLDWELVEAEAPVTSARAAETCQHADFCSSKSSKGSRSPGASDLRDRRNGSPGCQGLLSITHDVLPVALQSTMPMAGLLVLTQIAQHFLFVNFFT